MGAPVEVRSSVNIGSSLPRKSFAQVASELKEGELAKREWKVVSPRMKVFKPKGKE